jgi:hypothetical protein
MPQAGPVGVVPSSSPADEVAALLAIKRVLDPPGTALTDWQPGRSTACGWTGVTCDASSKQVTRIDFWNADPKAKLKLSGQLPSGALLRRLPGLVTFGVEGTGVGGPLPEDWSQLRQLEELFVVGNMLTGGWWAERLRMGALVTSHMIMTCVLATPCIAMRTTNATEVEARETSLR